MGLIGNWKEFRRIDSRFKLKNVDEKEMSKTIAAKVSKLEDLIEYQQGSVVSRAIIDKKTGTITLFAFDENQALSEHNAPYDALVYVLDGEVGITISGKQLRLKTGEMIIIPANSPHALIAKTKFKMVLVMIKS